MDEGLLVGTLVPVGLLCVWTRRRHFELSFQQYYYMGVGAAEAGRPLGGCVARAASTKKPR